jgi:hypothetical protein
MKQRAWYRLLVRVAVVALPAAVLVGLSPPPAQAHACWGGQSITVSQSVASADVTFYPLCSDNRSHWHGVIRDTRCDSRAGKVLLMANPAFPPGGGVDSVWTHAYSAPNGCGTEASFSGSDLGLGSPWRLLVRVGACNTWSCSDYTSGSLYG